MITYERWREVYLVQYRGALYVNYNSQKLLFPHNACTASEVQPPPPPLLGPRLILPSSRLICVSQFRLSFP